MLSAGQDATPRRKVCRCPPNPLAGAHHKVRNTTTARGRKEFGLDCSVSVRTKYVSRYSIAASLLLCLRIIQNGGTTKKKKKIQSPCTFNMLYGSSEKQQQNLHTKE
uniref:Uncharacterized protein n=1 Tax=Setaria italica TaxID=4555 RepID=K3Y081_SETIT